MGGDQWKINQHHIPMPDYYKVLVVLDGEHLKNVEQEKMDPKINIKVSKISDCKDNLANWYCISKNSIEDEFQDVFNPVSMDKPIGLAMQIWEMNSEKIPMEIQEILKWCLEKAGAKING